MIHPRQNFRNLLRFWKREIARSYLHAIAADHLKKYPQMCCFSFEAIGLDINIYGRFDHVALCHLVTLMGPGLAGRGVLDVGANIGNHSAAFATVAGHVIAFEPHPLTYHLLKINMSQFENVSAFNLGASDRPMVVRAISTPLNHGSTAISEAPLRSGESAWMFSVAPIDDHPMVGESDVAMIKIDVEGHELQTLRGAKATIFRCKPVIVLEQNEDVIDDGSSEAFEFLKSCGYAHFYSLDVEIPWRSPPSLPGPLRKLARATESIVFGPCDYQAMVRPVSRLEKRGYPMLIAAFKPLAVDGNAGAQSYSAQAA